MTIEINKNLKIVKSPESWDVIQMVATKNKKDGSEGTRKKMTYHGTLEQALKKACDISLAEGNLTTDLSLVYRKVHEIQAEMHMLAKRIETSLVLQI